MVTVKDNYLSEEEHQTLYNIVSSEYFPWYFNWYTNFYVSKDLEFPYKKIVDPHSKEGIKQDLLKKERINIKNKRAPHAGFSDSDINETDLESFQFVHVFYNLSRVNSSEIKIVEPILTKLNYKALIRVKLNLNPYSQKLMVWPYHQDQAFKAKAAIYYLNTNNGYTLFKKGKKKINSVKNRIVFFDADDYHLGTNSTNCKNRLVLNINYF